MIWVAVILGVILAVILFLLNFYRDPKRTVPNKKNIIVSPADGKVISIIDTKKRIATINKGFLGKIKAFTKDVADECYLVSIFMSPLDVHVNRAPISGIVKKVKHTKGHFFKAYDLARSFENENNEILFQDGKLKVKAIQIAGFLARRVVCKVKPNQKVKIGQRIGLISLGSQTTLVLPKNIELKVKVGDKVKGAMSIIAVVK